MNRILISLFFFFLISNQSMSEENIMILKLKDGDVKIELYEDVAPNHVKRIKELANSGKYNGVVFHRVIDGFMAQTGDVKFGNSSSDDIIFLYFVINSANFLISISISLIPRAVNFCNLNSKIASTCNLEIE